MEESRQRTLKTLIDLAEGSSPNDCWDDRRAEDLLRSQSSAEELRSLGMSEKLIKHVFAGDPAAHPAERSVNGANRFSVRVQATFEAAHFLREYRGISEPLHGHSYRIEAELAGQGGGLDSDAISVDFVSARRKLEELARRLDYGCINDVPPFDVLNPSAENVAEWFANELFVLLAEERVVVVAVTLFEGPVNSVTFRPRGY